MTNDPEQMTDEQRAEVGIATDYTLENLCPECGNALGENFIDDQDAAPYGRPGRTCALHPNCKAQRDNNVG